MMKYKKKIQPNSIQTSDKENHANVNLN